MTGLRHLLWWCLALSLAPLLMLQAWHARRRTPRLPDADGPQQGVCPGAGKPLRLLLVGESTVTGVGVASQQQGLAAQLAEVLAERLQRPVQWRACGENGITAGDACTRLLPQVRGWPADISVLVFGVNDSTRLSAAGRWRAALGCLSTALAAGGAQLVFSGVPRLQDFRALPWPLRQVLGLRAALLDCVLREVAGEQDGLYCALAVRLDGDSLALDGYHPSALGYRRWAEALATCIIARARLPEG